MRDKVPAFRMAGPSFSIVCILHHAHAYNLHVVSRAGNSYDPTQVVSDDISRRQRSIHAHLTTALNKTWELGSVSLIIRRNAVVKCHLGLLTRNMLFLLSESQTRTNTSRKNVCVYYPRYHPYTYTRRRAFSSLAYPSDISRLFLREGRRALTTHACFYN